MEFPEHIEENPNAKKLRELLTKLISEGKITEKENSDLTENAIYNFEETYEKVKFIYDRKIGCPAMIGILAKNALIRSHEAEFLYRRLASENEAEVRTAINEIITLFDRNRSSLGYR